MSGGVVVVVIVVVVVAVFHDGLNDRGGCKGCGTILRRLGLGLGVNSQIGRGEASTGTACSAGPGFALRNGNVYSTTSVPLNVPLLALTLKLGLGLKLALDLFLRIVPVLLLLSLPLLLVVPRSNRPPLPCEVLALELVDDESARDPTQSGMGKTRSWLGVGPGRGCVCLSRGMRNRYA
jgi:hypothetical protein